MIGLMIFEMVIAIAAGIGVWFAERVDRPRRRAMRDARGRPAEPQRSLHPIA